MQRFLKAVGVVAIVLVATAAGAIGMMIYGGNKLDSESHAYVDAVVPAVARDWNKQALIARAAPEFLQNATPAKLDRLFTLCETLGHLENYDGASGSSNMMFLSGSGMTITARYTAKARFENGDADFRLDLVKRNGQWAITGWHVSSPGPVRPAVSRA